MVLKMTTVPWESTVHAFVPRLCSVCDSVEDESDMLDLERIPRRLLPARSTDLASLGPRRGPFLRKCNA